MVYRLCIKVETRLGHLEHMDYSGNLGNYNILFGSSGFDSVSRIPGLELDSTGTYETRNGMEWNQLGCTLVKIYYVALAVPKFASLFPVVLLCLVVFLY